MSNNQIYILNVNRQIYSNTFLEYISINQVNWLDFAKTTVEYTVE